MTIRDEIDALPGRPKQPEPNPANGKISYADHRKYEEALFDYERAWREMAERLLRAIDAACDHGVSSEVFEIACNNARAYLARREAE